MKINFSSHKKIVIHVPYKVHHVHHTHTIYKHVHGHGGGGDHGHESSSHGRTSHSHGHGHDDDDHEYYKVIGYSGDIDSGMSHGDEGHGSAPIASYRPIKSPGKYGKQLFDSKPSSEESSSFEDNSSFGNHDSHGSPTSFKPSSYGKKHKSHSFSTIKYGSFSDSGKYHKKKHH